MSVAGSLEEALARPADVLVDYTSPDSVKQRTLQALARGVRVVIGTSGLTAADYQDIERRAIEQVRDAGDPVGGAGVDAGAGVPRATRHAPFL